MTETTVQAAAELTAADRAELEALRAAKDTAAESTRAKSPAKPQDHKPALKFPIVVEFAGEEYTFDRRATSDIDSMFALRDGDFKDFLTRVIGEDGLERAKNSLKDEDGYADFEKLSDLVGAMLEKAGAKN